MGPARAVIFDLDGTLVDSAPDIAAALNRALEGAALAPLPLRDVKAMVGHGARRLVERGLAARGITGNEDLTASVLAAFHLAYHDAPCRHTRIYPGADATLRGLRAGGWRMAVCTNKPQALADGVIDGVGMRHWFDAVVGGRDGVPLKPAADMVHLALAEARVAGFPAVLVGDSRADLGAGRAAGLPVVLLAHGYSDAAVGGLGADAVADGFGGLGPVIEALLAAA